MAQAAETDTTTPPAVSPIPTAATAEFLRRPVIFYGRSARDVLRAVALELFEPPDEHRRLRIECALERLGNLQERLLAKLNAMDGDPDLEAEPDLEADPDESSLSATEAIDQRGWSLGGSSDLEWEHDGREPDCSEACPWPDEGDQSKFPGAPA